MNKSFVEWIAEIIAIIIMIIVAFFCGRAPDNNLTLANPVLPALLSGLGSMAVSTVGNLLNNEINKANWKRQNEYNSPAEQMNRYQAAGLNPNLIYGSGQASAGNAGAIAPYQNPGFNASSILETIQTMQAIRESDARVKLMKAQAEEHDAVAFFAGQNAAYETEQNRYKSLKGNMEVGEMSQDENGVSRYVKYLDELLKQARARAGILEEENRYLPTEHGHNSKMWPFMEKAAEGMSKIAEYQGDHAALTYWSDFVSNILDGVFDAIFGWKKAFNPVKPRSR